MLIPMRLSLLVSVRWTLMLRSRVREVPLVVRRLRRGCRRLLLVSLLRTALTVAATVACRARLAAPSRESIGGSRCFDESRCILGRPGRWPCHSGSIDILIAMQCPQEALIVTSDLPMTIHIVRGSTVALTYLPELLSRSCADALEQPCTADPLRPLSMPNHYQNLPTLPPRSNPPTH